MVNKISETVDGVEYASLTSIAKAYNLKLPTLARRYRLGKRGNDLVGPLDPNKVGHKTTIDGVTYETFADLARAYNMKQSTISNRYIRGYRGADLVAEHLQDKHIEIDGKVYPNYVAVAEAFDVPVDRVRRRYARNMRGRKLVDERIVHKNSKPITVHGIEYVSLAELARDYGVSRQLVHSRYKQGVEGDDLVRGRERVGTVGSD